MPRFAVLDRGLFIRALVTVVCLAPGAASLSAQELPGSWWRYYRPTNTGIQGDSNEAVWVGPDGDPWIGGYSGTFEEGGVAKLLRAENRWLNFSNVDFPVIGHPSVTGTARVTDIAADADGKLWMTTWRGVLRIDPAVGASSLVNFAGASPALANGGARDVAVAPDGSIWFALVGYGSALGGVVRHVPATAEWKYWTGGGAPQGGDGWPVEVWSSAHLGVQPTSGGGYVVWADSANGNGYVAFDSATLAWTWHPHTQTPGSVFALPGKESVDDAGNLWARRFAGFVNDSAVYTLDYRTPDGTWVTPPQPQLAAVVPSIWAFRAFGAGEAVIADGDSRIRHFHDGAWEDLGIWRDGAFTYDLDVDASGNVWVVGVGGAAMYEATSGTWQRYRLTNTSQFDFFNDDLVFDPASGDVYACANAGGGIGGMTRFDGERWTGFDVAHYGLGVDWPFASDNCAQVGFRASTGTVVPNPLNEGLHEWDGSQWNDLGGSSESVGMVEDSLGRLWSLGPYFSLRYYDGSLWHTAENNGSWGNDLERDPSRPGTVWASTSFEVFRTDGVYRFARTTDQIAELDPQSDGFTTLAAAPGGIAWVGTSQGLVRLDAVTGNYQYFTELGGISTLEAQPLAVTPDGRLWFSVFHPAGGGPHGLAWYDGATAGLYPAPLGGEAQWGGLPHAQITALETRETPGGYELWMSCASRGIAVLTVPIDAVFTDGFESGDFRRWLLPPG